MKQVALGGTGLQVSPLVFGANVFGWTVSERDAFSLLDAMVDAGLNFIDTADVYPAWVPGNRGGESEAIIGKWLARSGRRDQVVIATKVGLLKERPGQSAANIAAAAEDALRRLGIETIDLYYSHRDDPETPLEETLGAHARLIEQGRVRAIGASNFSAARLAEALDLAGRSGLPAFTVLQPEYNLYNRAGYEAELEPLVQARGLGVCNYYALASGFLTGKYRSADDAAGRARGTRVKAYLDARGLRILAALDTVAARHRVVPATVALAWLIARPSITAPIASATSREQLQDLIRAATLELSREDIAALDAASAGG
ncbi:MAG: aldo/keto reductase [Lautropia sp.]